MRTNYSGYVFLRWVCLTGVALSCVSVGCVPIWDLPTCSGAATDDDSAPTDDDDSAPCLDPDADGDGHPSEECGGDDCDDTNPLSYPGAEEACDGEDNDCDEIVPANEVDGDGDNYRVCDGDCDDNNVYRHPDADEDCWDGEENNCDHLVDEADPQCSTTLIDSTQADVFGVSCSQCHNGADTTGLDLSSSSTTFATSVDQPVSTDQHKRRVVPCRTAESYLWRKIQGTQHDGSDPMPGDPAIEQWQRDAVERWILSGARLQ